MLAHIDDIKGAKRKQNLLEHAEDARVSKQLATVQRDLDVDFDIAAEAAREPDRSRVREVFREYELRDPLRRLEEALGDPDVAAPAPQREVTLTARVRAGAVPTSPALGAAEAELAVAVRAERGARGRAVRRGLAVALRGGRTTARCSPGDCDGPRGARRGCGERPVVAHDAKALGLVPRRLVHDTLLGAYLLEPARRGYPFAELCEERGLAQRRRGPASPRRRAAAGRAGRLAARADRRARPRAR